MAFAYKGKGADRRAVARWLNVARERNTTQGAIHDWLGSNFPHHCTDRGGTRLLWNSGDRSQYRLDSGGRRYRGCHRIFRDGTQAPGLSSATQDDRDRDASCLCGGQLRQDGLASGHETPLSYCAHAVRRDPGSVSTTLYSVAGRRREGQEFRERQFQRKSSQVC